MEAAAGAVTLGPVVHLLENLLVREKELLSGLHRNVEVIRDGLVETQSILREADNIGDQNSDNIRPWLGQLREIAYDIEDVLEKYTTYFVQPQGSGFLGFLRATAPDMKHLFAKRKLANEIQKIRNHLCNLSEHRPAVDATSAARDMAHHRPVAALFIDEAELEGIDEPRKILIERLVEEEPELRVTSVVAMGGMGKTTLVRKVFEEEIVKAWFDCHAWITVTHSYTPEELLKSIIFQLFDERLMTYPRQIDKMGIVKLTETLRQFLRHEKYIVVLDDLWHIQAWEELKYALPYNHFGSRVLITTQYRNVGLSCINSGGHIYDLKPLSEDHAWKLFCKKAFPSLPGKKCPPEQRDISGKIVKACSGLPLAIVTIAGLLSRRGNALEWMALYENLQSELRTNPTLENMKNSILLLSYNDLPHYLKRCFLYFSIFPKNYPVKRITLVRLWMAEGFIDNSTGETMEKVAEDYLGELIDRSMVQVAESYDYGRLRSCRVHNLIYDIISLKSKEENFSTCLIERGMQTNREVRRLAVHGASEGLAQNTHLSHARAFFMFGADADFINSQWRHFHVFKILRVLDLEDAPIDNFPVDFGKLIHLRYLSFRNTRICKLSKSLGKLRNLQTLDLKGTYVSELPKAILKLRNLRHLLAYHYYMESRPPYYYAFGVKLPKGINKLRELQKLTYLEANKHSITVGELGMLTQLKRLGIVKLSAEDGVNLCASIGMLINLRSLSVTSSTMDEHLNLHSLNSPPPDLERLYLRGSLHTLPSWMMSLNHLVRLRLRWSRLLQNSLEVLKYLPRLVELALIRAYDDANLHFVNEGFQKLEILHLEGLDNLTNVFVEMAMPYLKKIYINSCLQLTMVPSGIENLKEMKELHVINMPEKFVQRLQKNGRIDYTKISHIPIMHFDNNEDSVFKDISA